MKVIYVAHPYAGEEGNYKTVEELLRKLTIQHPNYLFLSGITSFGYCYFNLAYQSGMDRCLWLLGLADEMWVYGDYRGSRGCLQEIQYCENHAISYRICALDIGGNK